MDCGAILLASDSCLQDIGLQAKGDILSLKAFAQKRHNSVSNENTAYDEKKRKLIEILKKGKDTRTQPSKKAKEEVKIFATVNKEKTRKITLEWMHYHSATRKFITVRITNGGGTRRVDLPLGCSKEDIIELGKNLFFPKGVSSHGNSENMLFDLSNFQGNPIPESIQDASGGKPFTLQRYIEQYKLTQVRIYLTSKYVTLDTCDDNDDSDLMESVFKKQPKNKRQKFLTYLATQDDVHYKDTINGYPSDSETESLDHSVSNSLAAGTDLSNRVSTSTINESEINHHLMGTSEERQDLRKEQDKEFQLSLEED